MALILYKYYHGSFTFSYCDLLYGAEHIFGFIFLNVQLKGNCPVKVSGVDKIPILCPMQYFNKIHWFQEGNYYKDDMYRIYVIKGLSPFPPADQDFRITLWTIRSHEWAMSVQNYSHKS